MISFKETTASYQAGFDMMTPIPDSFSMDEYLESFPDTHFGDQSNLDQIGEKVDKHYYVESPRSFKPLNSGSTTSGHSSPDSISTHSRNTTADVPSDREKVARRRVQNRISQRTFRARKEEAYQKAKQETKEEKQVSASLRLQLEDSKAEVKRLKRVLSHVEKAAGIGRMSQKHFDIGKSSHA